MKLLTLHARRPITEAEVPNGKHWGFHLMLDISGTNDNTKDADKLSQFIKSLVKAVHMKPVGEPVIKHFGKTPKLYGYSIIQLIETSSITFHLIDANRTAYLDVFSCKPFDPDIVVKMVTDEFGVSRIKKRFVYRDAE